jgi:hypothetical protein
MERRGKIDASAASTAGQSAERSSRTGTSKVFLSM